MIESRNYFENLSFLSPWEKALIDNSYNLSNEIQFCQDWLSRGVGLDVVYNYLENNLLSLILEFALGVNIQYASYQFKENQIFHFGTSLPVSKMLQGAATLASSVKGFECSEISVLHAWQKIESYFAAGARTVLQVSPPCAENGNYGFLYEYTLDENGKILLRARRYDENKANLPKSRRLAQVLNINTELRRTALSLIEQPVVINNDDLRINNKLALLGLPASDTSSKRAEHLILNDPLIKELIFNYQNAVFTNNKQAQEILYQIFSRGKILARQLADIPSFGPVSGSSCVALSGNIYRTPFPLPFNGTFEERVTTCPHCGKQQKLSDKHRVGLKCYNCQSPVGKEGAECIVDKSDLIRSWQRHLPEAIVYDQETTE